MCQNNVQSLRMQISRRVFNSSITAFIAILIFNNFSIKYYQTLIFFTVRWNIRRYVGRDFSLPKNNCRSGRVEHVIDHMSTRCSKLRSNIFPINLSLYLQVLNRQLFLVGGSSGNIRAKFENLAVAGEEENRKRVEEEKARRKAKEERDRREAERKQQVKKKC